MTSRANISRLVQMSAWEVRPAWFSKITWSTPAASNSRSRRRIVSGEPFFSRMLARGTAFSLGNLSSLKDAQAILGGEYVFSGAITRPDVIAKRPQIVQKVVTALVKASHFIETKTPEQIADAVPADLVGDRAQYIEALRASREIYAPQGMVSPGGVETVMKSLESFGVFKDAQKVDVATTYDMKFVKQAVKDLKLP